MKPAGLLKVWIETPLCRVTNPAVVKVKWLRSTVGGVDKRTPPTSVTGFDSSTRRNMWVKFAVGSRLALRAFPRVRRFSSLYKNQQF